MTTDRIHFFDNIKALLVVLVVFGHLIEYFVDTHDLFKWLYISIYSFHMPLFIFASGFLSKNNDFRKAAPNILLQFIFFNILYLIFIGIIFWLNPSLIEASLNQLTLNTNIDIIMAVLTPYWIMWYMLSLFFWKALLILFKKSPLLLIVAFIIGTLFGFVNIHGRVLSIQRTFALFPFFLAGYFIDYKVIEKFTKKPLIKKILIAMAIIICGVFYFYIDEMAINIFYYSDSFSYLGFYGFDGVVNRIILYAISIVMSAAFMILVPHKHMMYSDIGLKTFNIYILHGFVIQTFWAFGFFDSLKKLNVTLVFLILILLNVIIVTVLSSNYVTRLMKEISLKISLKKGKN